MTATTDEIDCSVLVPVLNEERYIAHSVAAMRRQRFNGVLEFVFADGGSEDRTREILEGLAVEDPRIRIFDNPRRTVSSGLNVALAHARGRWVARMDAHTEYPEEYVAHGVTRLLRGGTAWVSGPQEPKGDGRIGRAVELALRSPIGRGGSRKWGSRGGQLGAEYELDSGVFSGVWERSTLLGYGGWDERWAVNEDSEMAGRFLERGERIVCLPEMGAEYAPRNSLVGLWRQYLRYGEFRTRTACRHPATLRPSALLPPAVVLDAGAALLAPRPLRSVARCLLGVYGAVLGGAAICSIAPAESPADAALTPVALMIMHTGHGLGMLRGAVRHGLPLAALRAMASGGRRAQARARSPEPVFAPSLRDRNP